jgi:uncharacterized protein (TIGR03085 family)
VQARLTERRTFTDIVEGFRWLPGLWPSRLPGVDDTVNTVELVIHHEDVRRAVPGWEPRVLAPRLEAHLSRQLGLIGRVLLRRSQVGVRLETPAGEVLARHRARGGGEAEVVVRGDPLELLLFAYGRRRVADVALGGPEPAIDTLAATPLGL